MLIAHAQRSYAVGMNHGPDLHRELLERGEPDSVVLADELLQANGATVDAVIFRRRAAIAELGRVGTVWNRLMLPLQGWDRHRWFARQLRELTPTLVHAHFGDLGAELAPICTEQRLPLVVTFYGVDVSAVLNNPRWKKRYRVMLGSARRLVVLCDAAADRLQRAGADADRIEVWNCLVDLSPFPARRRVAGPRLRLITAARFVEKKGYPTMLRALHLLRGRGIDAELTALGYGRMLAQIKAMVSELGIGDRVHFIDTKGEPDFLNVYAKALEAADVFILPSTVGPDGDDEGGPALSMVMAQATGLPVVCTPFPGSERSVVEGETGLFCRENDAESLADRIVELYDDPQRRDRLGREGAGLVRKSFALDQQVDAMKAIYARALA